MPFKNTRVDRVLEKVSIGYFPEGFISHLIGTPVPVMKRSGIFGSYGNSHLQLLNTIVQDRGGYKVVPSIERSVDNKYYLGKHGLVDFVTEEDKEEVEDPFDAQQDSVLYLKSLLSIEREYAVSFLLTQIGTYESSNVQTLSGTSQFNDYSNSNPLEVFAAARAGVQGSSGVIADTAIMDYRVMTTLIGHPQLTTAQGSSPFTPLSLESLKRALDVKNILISHAQYVDSNGDRQSFFGNNIIFYNQASSQMKRQSTFIYRLENKKRNERVTIKDANDLVNSERVFLDMMYQYKIGTQGAGYLIQNAIA